MSKDPQVFPCINPHYDGNWNKEPVIQGMSLRDYFAANAMKLISIDTNYSGEDRAHGLPQMHAKRIAIFSYMVADAMLKAREVDVTNGV